MKNHFPSAFLLALRHFFFPVRSTIDTLFPSKGAKVEGDSFLPFSATYKESLCVGGTSSSSRSRSTR